jgi:hypothetical protein
MVSQLGKVRSLAERPKDPSKLVAATFETKLNAGGIY